MKPKFVYLHYCPKDGCFPHEFFDYSKKPVKCPDCGTLSIVRSFKEMNEKKERMSYPVDGMAIQFMMQPYSPKEKYHCPDHGIGLALDKVSQSLGGKDRSDVEETVNKAIEESKWWKFW